MHLPYLGSGFGPGDGAPIEASLVADVSEQLHALAGEVEREGVPVEALLRVGHPASEVVDVAQREGIALIVMGTHGRSAPLSVRLVRVPTLVRLRGAARAVFRARRARAARRVRVSDSPRSRFHRSARLNKRPGDSVFSRAACG